MTSSSPSGPNALVANALQLARAVVGVLRRLVNPPIRATSRRATERLGTQYGGWTICPDAVGMQSIVYSFGVGEDVSFDLDLIRRFGCTVHAFDPTPRSIEWVREQAVPPEFVMHEYGLAGHDGTVSFYPPEDPTHVSHTLIERAATADRKITVPVKRLSTIMRELGHARIDLLKMDVEGAEYDAIEDLLRDEIRPRQVLVEYHHRFPGVGAARTRASIALLRRAGYELFAVSASGEEFSLMLSKQEPLSAAR